MKRILQLTKRRIVLSLCLMFTILAMLSFTLSQEYGTKVHASSPSATTSSHYPGFESHLLRQYPPTFTVRSKTTAVPDALPPASCLNLYMSLHNPQIDVVEVYVQVQNFCGVTVSNIVLSWDTGGKCNGNQFLGPNGAYTVGSLNTSSGWSRKSDWSAICYGSNYPYFPVSYTMAGFDDAHGNAPRFAANGSYDTQTYTFI